MTASVRAGPTRDLLGQMCTDKHGRPLAAYPETAECGRPPGVNVFGNTADRTAETVSLALLDETGTLRIPPR